MKQKKNAKKTLHTNINETKRKAMKWKEIKRKHYQGIEKCISNHCFTFCFVPFHKVFISFRFFFIHFVSFYKSFFPFSFFLFYFPCFCFCFFFFFLHFTMYQVPTVEHCIYIQNDHIHKKDPRNTTSIMEKPVWSS